MFNISNVLAQRNVDRQYKYMLDWQRNVDS